MSSFNRLYALAASGIYRYLLGLSRDPAQAEDLFQETFLQLHRARRAYDGSRAFWPWIVSIARHVYLTRARATRRRRETPLVVDPPRPVGAAGPPFAVRLQLERALGRLPASSRLPLVLHHVYGFSFKEVAGQLGIRDTAARLRASRGLAQLRGLYAGEARGEQRRGDAAQAAP